MEVPAYLVSKVFSNNAVLARLGDEERVIVGRGIGFGRRVGERIPADQVQCEYFELSPDRVHYLDLMNSFDQRTFDTCVEAIKQAADLLGELHPSVYMVLADHLAFVVQRLREGNVIHNPLIDEIRATFPDEFIAAEVVLRYVNSSLDVELPPDEKAFITLHLNAARVGTSVKLPLQQANALAGIVQFARERLGYPGISGAVHDELIWALDRLTKRLRAGTFRSNAAARSVERDLPLETELASQIVERIWASEPLPHGTAGEVAYLAVFLHGWKQDAGNEMQIDPARQKGATR
ncbi:MAG: PRD domain-containing protein [Propionibacteriaceae bacterium]|jgi:transcriptional antiterminator|nr:PRD domain-containing protein [Propionibacteriaceae bacterium]